MVNATDLAVPDYSKPFVIHTNASDVACAAALSQENDSGVLKPLAFTSAKFSGPQVRWATIEKEAFAIVHALQQFRVIVFGHRIILYTDNNPLQFLSSQLPRSPKLARWSLSLLPYDVEVRHVSGQSNVVSDFLSRSF